MHEAICRTINIDIVVAY